MRFLVDECTGTSVADWLKSINHEVFSVFEQWRGAIDDEI
jgi:predicted nuclease of predicted toxin-antitoxin system